MKDLGMDTVSVQELIVSTLKRRGDGKENPIRVITEIFTKDGEKVAEYDPCLKDETFTKTDLLNFSRWILSSGIHAPGIDDVKKWITQTKAATS